MTDEEFTPPVDPSDLKSAWAAIEQANKHLPDRDPNQGKNVQKVIHVDCKQACSPGANIEAVCYRCSQLNLLHHMSKAGTLVFLLQHMNLDSTWSEVLTEPNDAVFKAFATVRMNRLQRTIERKEFPVDLGDLARLLSVPTTPVEDHKQRQNSILRFLWKQIVNNCREVGKPEPDPAQLAEWEADDKGVAEMSEEFVRVSRAWAEAHQSGDSTALKCEAESKDSMANRKLDVRERLDLINKWYVANRGELKSPLWEKIVRS